MADACASTARLDRLGSAKEVAQVAAVIGREFFYELLQAVLPISEAELQSALAKLADAELIYARGIPPEATYQFKHALIISRVSATCSKRPIAGSLLGLSRTES